MVDQASHEEAVGSRTEWILSRCRELGFALAGVCDALPTQREREFRAWLEQSKHGEMAYMARNLEVWLDPRELLPGARSIICVAERYPGIEHRASVTRRVAHTRGQAVEECVHERRPLDPPGPLPGGEEQTTRGRIARYARGEDYHLVMKERLHRLCDELRTRFPHDQFRTCVDTAPLPEREHAQRAGLGAVGKHTLLIDRDGGHGSWLLLGEIVTTLQLQPSESRVGEDPCGTCTRCIDACPTHAITPWSVDATRCISYLTIEHRSAIDERFHAPMGDWVFGCDVCQEVCPHNQPTRHSAGAAAAQPAYAPRQHEFNLLELLQWTDANRREAFARSSMKRAKLAMMKRNALIAAGNALARGSGSSELLRAIRHLAECDENELVQRTAAAVLRALT